ncbi:RNA-binding transcriptional accessory protein [Microlunatus elymi]|uniref:RNA-binding transcriptional accessory protein n=1 Tax=Microlunatus elymi TaxID=2596828 RepID=A0A516PWW7_9ACTN|nr:Tex family protein [Microlunatus elymi]QDP95665.1 RNA-binding transcriptional accessory protein [Microlunatus elymi]
MSVQTIEGRIATELEVGEAQVLAAVRMLDEGSTVPFIARYRKEITGGLDDTQLRTLEERLRYLRELDERKQTILESIERQGKLTDELKTRVTEAETKARLEDIYLPYKPKRRTKAMVAREAGLEPLADALLADPTLDPQETAAGYVDEDKGVADVAAALDGARAILIERFAEDADLIGELRERLWNTGRLVSKVRDGMKKTGAKFSDYFDFAEPFTSLPSHRILALNRGEREEVLTLTVSPDAEDPEPATTNPVLAKLNQAPTKINSAPSEYENVIARRFGISDQHRPADRWLQGVVGWAWRTKILVGLGIDVRIRLRQLAEDTAIDVFATGVKDVLMAAPAGTRATLGLDPGLRTGVKVAVVDATGKVVDTGVIYPHAPKNQWDESVATLAKLCAVHRVDLIAIGNGTASRETEKLAAQLIRKHPELELTKAVVSEAGASVYSASAYAAEELPELDVTLRGAVSIARRLQDPLAELVKIDPKSIGVGQYQHDLSEVALSRSLDAVVEDCVNAVGVDVNTASAPLLTRVSGITPGLAENIVRHRDQHGRFSTRTALLEVPRLGPKAYEQAAGFLRIRGGDEPLDGSAVHPESYEVVRKIQAAAGVDHDSLIGKPEVLQGLKPKEFVDEQFGLPTVTDIFAELEKPGRDPRPAFETAEFTDGVETLTDLVAGMILEGQVTNVAAFGAFVDIGVHQDGLVHISAMSKSFVSDPRDVAKTGDVVKVKVLEVDLERKRISLTMRLDDDQAPADGERKADAERKNNGRRSGPRNQQVGNKGKGRNGKPQQSRDRKPAPANTAMADALRRAGLG